MMTELYFISHIWSEDFSKRQIFFFAKSVQFFKNKRKSVMTNGEAKKEDEQLVSKISVYWYFKTLCNPLIHFYLQKTSLAKCNQLGWRKATILGFFFKIMGFSCHFQKKRSISWVLTLFFKVKIFDCSKV